MAAAVPRDHDPGRFAAAAFEEGWATLRLSSLRSDRGSKFWLTERPGVSGVPCLVLRILGELRAPASVPAEHIGTDTMESPGARRWLGRGVRVLAPLMRMVGVKGAAPAFRGGAAPHLSLVHVQVVFPLT